MRVELVIAIESLVTECTVWMSLEAALIDRTWVVITITLMLSQFWPGEELMLVCKNFLVTCT
jgi:hypothetical protein